MCSILESMLDYEQDNLPSRILTSNELNGHINKRSWLSVKCFISCKCRVCGSANEGLTEGILYTSRVFNSC